MLTLGWNASAERSAPAAKAFDKPPSPAPILVAAGGPTDTEDLLPGDLAT